MVTSRDMEMGSSGVFGPSSSKIAKSQGQLWRSPMNRNRGRDYDADLDDSDSAQSVDSTGKRKSFRRLIKRFAEKTSMQGPPYINNAKLLVAKIIWSVLLVIAIVALGLHLWFLFTQFYGWPVKTNVQLGFSNLRFPDVTICNTNPIHKGRFDQATGIKQLKQLVSDLNPRNLVPDQFDANYNPLADTQNPPPTNPDLPTDLPSNPSQGTPDPASTKTNKPPDTTTTTSGISQQNTESHIFSTQPQQSTILPNSLSTHSSTKSSNTQQSQSTTRPANTQQSQSTIHFANTQQSQSTTRPENTQLSQRTTRPANTQQSQSTIQYTNSQQTQIMTQPANTQQSQRTTQSTTTQQSQGTTRPTNTQQSPSTTRSTNTQQLQSTTRPTNTQQTQSTTRPTNTQQTQSTTRSSNTQQSQSTTRSTITQQSPNTTRSSNSQQSQSTTRSTNTQQSQSTTRLTNTQQSQNTTDLPITITENPQTTTNPSNSQRSQRTTNLINTEQTQSTSNPPQTQGTTNSPNSQSTQNSNTQRNTKSPPNKSTITQTQQITTRPQSSQQDSGARQNAQTTTTPSITESQTTTDGVTQAPGPPTPPTGNGPPPLIRKKRFVSELDNLNISTYDSEYVDTLTNKELTDSEFDGKVSKTAEIRELYEELYMDITKKNRGDLGHQIQDMLLDCTFNGRECDQRLFRIHQTAEYGNCWILNSDKFTVTNSGPSGGLSMVLYLEVQEYLKGLTTGYGLRIQIHEPETFPYPAEEGLYIPSSMETDIGLKMTLIDRIAGNYGDCSDGVSFNRVYTRKYTRRACHRQCEMMAVVLDCDCFSDEHEILARTYNDSLRPCRSNKEKGCESRVLRQFDTKTSQCDCPNPCKEIQYTKAISSRQWPNDDYARVLLQSICNENKEVCATLRTDINDQRIINNNFLKLNIYYEDLNFQNITEEPEIATAQFLSDVGGAVGLWIGLSILSMCEIIQLIVELIDYAVHRTIKRRRREQRRASRKLHQGRGNNDKHSKESDKHSKESGDKHSKESGDKKHSKPNGDLYWPHTSFGVPSPKDSPRSSRYLDIDRRPIGRISPLSDRRNNHLKDIRGYDSDSSRPSSGGKRSHGNDIGRGMRYDDDYFKRNYMMGY